MNFVSVIKYEGDNSVFIWKHPCEDFNSTTQLIVHESQEAVFLMNGQALDLFGPGRHTLETENIPLIRRFFSWATGGVSPFHCEVYFINKTEQMAIKWGTDSKIQFLEPTYQFPISIGASGEMSLRVGNSRKLLLKLVGTERDLTRENLTRQIRSILMTEIKSYLAKTIREENINIFSIDERLDDLSTSLKGRIAGDLEDYGLSLERFLVTTIVKPDGERQYEMYKELHFRQYADVMDAKIRQQVGVIDQQTEAQKRVIEAQSIAQKRALEGYTYQQERGFDVAETAAQNEGAGNFTSAGIGMGMIAGIGGAVSGAVGGVFNEAVKPIVPAVNPNADPAAKPNANPETQPLGFCGNCGFAFQQPSNFCPQCGTKREETK